MSTTRAGWRSRLRGRNQGRGSARGAAELSVLAVAASLVAGVLFGNGLSSTAVNIADGLTWLDDSPSGQAIQVNPATGQAEVRLNVSSEGHVLNLAEYAGSLLVTDETTGTLSLIDIARLTETGLRRVSPHGEAQTLSHGDHLFLIDRGTSSVSKIDPVVGDTVGAVWLSTHGLVDAAVDGEGKVWVLDAKGVLTTMHWSQSSLAFAIETSQQVESTGSQTRLLAHERGVTVFGPESGTVQQLATGHDVRAASPKLQGELAVPEKSPGELAVASAPDSSTVVIVADDHVREVDVAAIGCATPGVPEVFHGTVYVPCHGAAQVIRLTRTGESAGSSIPTPGEDPDLVLDDDNLVINVPGSNTGAVVERDGSVKSIIRYDEKVPTVTPGANGQPPAAPPSPIAPPPPPPPPPPSSHNPPPVAVTPSAPTPDITSTFDPTWPPRPDPSEPGPSHGNPSTSSSPTPSPSTRGPRPPKPTIPPIIPTRPSGSPSSTNPSASPTSTPTPPAPLLAPTGVSASALTEGQIQISWQHSGPAATSFVVTRSGGGDLVSVSGGQRQAVVTIALGEEASFVVSAIRDSERAVSAASNAVTAVGRPGVPAGVTATASFTGVRAQRMQVTATWEAAASNGSAITGYVVVIDVGAGAAQSQTVGPDIRSHSYTHFCPGDTPACLSGNYSVSVTAVNGVGEGPPGTDSGFQEPPVPITPEPQPTGPIP